MDGARARRLDFVAGPSPNGRLKPRRLEIPDQQRVTADAPNGIRSAPLLRSRRDSLTCANGPDIGLTSLRTAEDCRQVLTRVLAAIARGEIGPAEGARSAAGVCPVACGPRPRWSERRGR